MASSGTATVFGMGVLEAIFLSGADENRNFQFLFHFDSAWAQNRLLHLFILLNI
jgi:hypothetical protein